MISLMKLVENRDNVRYGCVMARIDEEASRLVLDFNYKIIGEELLYKEGEEFGREQHPHITIKYGLVNPYTEEQMKQLIRHVTPFNVKVKRMSIFENEKIDVVKFDVSVDGYVEKDDPKNIFIMADAYHFVKAFKKSVDYLREVVKHETRHSIQIKAEWDGKMKGLPKVGVRDPERDPYGVRKGGEGSRSAHVTRDIEFKPNVHTYAYHLKRYLSRNYPKSRWAEGLTTLLSFRGVFGRDDKAIEIAQMLDELRTTNPEKWRLFMKELYKEVFKNE